MFRPIKQIHVEMACSPDTRRCRQLHPFLSGTSQTVRAKAESLRCACGPNPGLATCGSGLEGDFFNPVSKCFHTTIVSVMVALQIAIFVFLRKGFYTAAVPVAVKGMFGPGAPHTFLLQRRCDSGQFVFCSGFNTGASRDLLAAW